jgi:hypothetical protein
VVPQIGARHPQVVERHIRRGAQEAFDIVADAQLSVGPDRFRPVAHRRVDDVRDLDVDQGLPAPEVPDARCELRQQLDLGLVRLAVEHQQTHVRRMDGHEWVHPQGRVVADGLLGARRQWEVVARVAPTSAWNVERDR